MTQRLAIYFAPAASSPLWRLAQSWLLQPELAALAMSARKYGFHATIKAPMRLATGRTQDELGEALGRFVSATAPVVLQHLAPRLIDGFLALTCEPQPRALTDFAAAVVTQFEPFRAPLTEGERTRRLAAPLSARQVELVDRFGYPYVLEQFQFHMTLSDRLPTAGREALLAHAAEWFAPALVQPVVLDRLVLYRQDAVDAAFIRLTPDFILSGST